MLVRGEDLDRFARVLCRLLGNGIRELFLNAAASSGDDLFCRLLHRPGFLSHLRSLKGYDEPEILVT